MKKKRTDSPPGHHGLKLALPLLASLIWLAAGALQAQTPPPDTPAAETPPAPAAIPAADIPARAEEASAHLRALEDRLAPEPALTEIEEALPQREKLLDEAAKRDGKGLDKLSLRELEDLRQSWLRRRVELDAWQTTLQLRLDALSREQKALDGLQAVWTATREATLREVMPEAVEQRVRTVVAEITRARARLNTRFDQLLSMQDRLSRLQVVVGDMLRAIGEATTSARGALLRLDGPPLWRALSNEASERQLATQVRDSVEVIRQALAEWYATFRPQIIAHASVTLALAALITMMRRRTRNWPREDRNVAAAMHVLERPIASALLVGLMLTPSFYPNASVFIGELAALAVIVPLLRLLPGLVYGPMRRPLYALAALYTLSRLHTLVIPRSGLDRLLLLVVALLALAGLIVLLRPGARTMALSTSRWWRWAVVAARIGALALAVALVANVAGAVALSEMLVEATLASALVGTILLAVVLVLSGMTTILLRTRRARRLRSIDRYGSLIESRVRWVLSAAALVVWLVITTLLLNVGSAIWTAITGALNASWQRGNVNLSLGDVLAFAAGVYLALLTSRFIRFVLEEDVLPRLPLARGVPNTITMLLNYFVLGLGFMLALAAAGVDLTRLTIIAGAVGVGVGFGLQNIVNNFVSGLILAFERPVQVGDLIEARGMVGRVTRIGIRSSTIRTGSGAEIIVPNANLVSNDVVNWTLSDRERKVELKVSVAYGNDPEKIVALLHDAVAKHERIAPNPIPLVTFDGFGDSALTFTVRCWGKTDDLLRTASDVAIAINAALTKAGIEIPYPQRDVRIRVVAPDPTVASLVAKT